MAGDSFFMYDRYIEIIGERYGLGTPVGKFSENGWQDKKVKRSNKFYADLDGVAIANTSANPYIHFAKDGYEVTVWAYASNLKHDTPVKELIIQKIEITSDREGRNIKNNVPWTLESGFTNTSTVKNMMERYPGVSVRDEERRDTVDEHHGENAYSVLLNKTGMSSPAGSDVWASLKLELRNGRKVFTIQFQTHEHLRTPQGAKLYVVKD